MSFNAQELAAWQSLLPKWTAYKRTAALTFTEAEFATASDLALAKLGKRPAGGCGSCWIEALRSLERIAGTQ